MTRSGIVAERYDQPHGDAAHRHYLQFDRPVWTIVASQIICVLIALNGVLLVALW